MSGVDIQQIDNKTTIFRFQNGSLQVTIKEGDLSAEVCDAIVNPTNHSMIPNGGLDTVLHRAMGDFFSSQVQAMSQQLRENACPVGNSRIFIAKREAEGRTPRFIINTVGPKYKKDEKDLAAFHLKECYCTSLSLANTYGLTSIAYPAISCGAYRYPPHEAARVGIETIRAHSYQVKDVRFVLFDRPVYEAFVKEWTDYSEEINKKANVFDDRDRPRTPPPQPPAQTTPTARFCVLCKQEQLSANQQLLCSKCTSLTRSQIFDKLLQQLCFAAEKSYVELERECSRLNVILPYYPLTYTPAQKFDQSIHKRDAVAEYYVQNQCDRHFRQDLMPMAVLGDGNCFYNTFVKLNGAGTATEASSITPVELRARNVIELVLNFNNYERTYPTLTPVLDHFQTYVVREMVHDTNYAAVWDLLSIPTVLNIQVRSVYPKVNGTADTHYINLNDKRFVPLINDRTGVLTLPEVKLLFSHCNKPVHLAGNDHAWVPNHFVPLLSLRQ